MEKKSVFFFRGSCSLELAIECLHPPPQENRRMSPKMFGPFSKGKDAKHFFSGDSLAFGGEELRAPLYPTKTNMFHRHIDINESRDGCITVFTLLRNFQKHGKPKNWTLWRYICRWEWGHFNAAMLVHQRRYVTVLLVLTGTILWVESFQNMGARFGF